MHVQLSSGARIVKFGHILYSCSYIVCTCSKSSGETVGLHSLVCAFIAHMCNKYQNLIHAVNCEAKSMR